jgi:tRNA(fMet)-specific endonuclease VapC
VSTSNRGIPDTSAVVPLERIEDPRSLPPEPSITAVTLAELSVGPSWPQILERASFVHCRRKPTSTLFPLMPPAVRAVAASLHRAGRNTGIRPYDVIIAAMALANDFHVSNRTLPISNPSRAWM